MTELSALNVKINGDASGLKAAASAAEKSVQGVGAAAKTATTKVSAMGTSLSSVTGTLGSTFRGALTSVKSGLTQTGAAFTKNANSIKMMSLQLSQVAQQTMAGGGFLRALAIQLPDIGLAFGTVGIAAGVLAGVALPLLADAFFDTSDASDKAKESADKLSSALQTLKTVSAGTGVIVGNKLTVVFKEQAEAVEALLQKLQDARFAEASASIQETLQSIGRDVGEFTGMWDQMAENLGDINNPAVKAALDNLMKQPILDSGLLIGELQQIEGAVNKIGDARGSDEFIASLAEAMQIADDLGGPVADAVVQGLIDMADKAGVLEEILARARSEGAALASSLSDAEYQTMLAYQQYAETRLAAPSEPVKHRETPSRGGGGGARANPLERELEAVQTSLMSQAELAQQTYMEQQEVLQAALEQRLITQQEYQTLMEQAAQSHADTMKGIDGAYQGDALSQAGSFFVDMASAMQSGNEKMFKIAQTFGAAQALISAWQGAAEALKLPFPQNLAAFSQVLATGLGAVNAIKSATASGSTTASSAATTAAAPATSNVVNVSLTGDTHSTNSVKDLFDTINSGLADGYRVNFV